MQTDYALIVDCCRQVIKIAHLFFPIACICEETQVIEAFQLTLDRRNCRVPCINSIGKLMQQSGFSTSEVDR